MELYQSTLITAAILVSIGLVFCIGGRYVTPTTEEIRTGLPADKIAFFHRFGAFFTYIGFMLAVVGAVTAIESILMIARITWNI